jgi:drug/metabolite transporter (DMT)-like permease
VFGVLFAVCAAASNAVGTVYQRKAARVVPAEETMHLALLRDLVRQPVWLVGIAGLIGGFVFQAAALHFALLTVVQPIVVGELPLTLLLGAVVFHLRVDREAIWGTVTVSAGVAAVLVATAPRPGREATTLSWLVASALTAVIGASLVAAALRTTASRRGALFGVAAGLGFGFTAALMNSALHHLNHGLAGLFGAWQLYATIAAGITSVFLAQNALQAGPLAAAQPPITTCDPLSSIVYGVLVFGEQLRGGYWIILTAAGGVAVLVGSVVLSRSALTTVYAPANAEPSSSNPPPPVRQPPVAPAGRPHGPGRLSRLTNR